VGTAGSWGGGIQFENVNVGLRNVQITDNKAIDKAGAIYLRDSNLNMYNCTIADNELLYGAWGAGIHAQKTGLGGHNYLYITNSIIRDNQNATFPNTGSQLAGDVFSSFGIDMYIHHTDIQGLGNYSNPWEMMAYFQLMLQDPAPGHENTNFDEDPLFITVDENDYHLGADSPCIDAGTDTLTVEGELIVDIPESEYFGAEPDMGANEWETENLGDINGDGSIDVLDVVMLTGFILNDESPVNGDLNSDGSVDVLDIVMIVNIILGEDLARGEKTENAVIYYGNGYCKYEADGAIAGIQLDVRGDYNITSDYLPGGWELVYNESTIMLYSLDGSSLEIETLFEYNGDLIIVESIVADWYGSDVLVREDFLPDAFSLERAYPNPFNPVTTLQYALPEDSRVSLTIYNLQGRVVAELVNDMKTAGYHSIIWNASNHASGMYFVKLMTPEFTKSQKLMLVK